MIVPAATAKTMKTSALKVCKRCKRPTVSTVLVLLPRLKRASKLGRLTAALDTFVVAFLAAGFFTDLDADFADFAAAVRFLAVVVLVLPRVVVFFVAMQRVYQIGKREHKAYGSTYGFVGYVAHAASCSFRKFLMIIFGCVEFAGRHNLRNDLLVKIGL